MKNPHLQLKISIIDPYKDENGVEFVVFNPGRKNIKTIDYICVSLYPDFYTFIRTLINSLDLLFRRNSIYTNQDEE